MLETIWNLILPNILEIIMAILSTVIAYYVIPYIKSDLIPWMKEKRLYQTVEKFVQAVEKLSESGAIPKELKKETVIKLLKKNGIEINSTVEAFIESAVKELDIITSTIIDEFVIDADKEIEEAKVIIETDNV